MATDKMMHVDHFVDIIVGSRQAQALDQYDAIRDQFDENTHRDGISRITRNG